MSSPTKQLKRIRKNKLVKSGRRRKRHARKYGSTPAFPIHVDGPAAKRAAAPAARAAKPAPISKTVARIALKTMSKGTKGAITENGIGASSDPRAK